ncbi:MAG: glutamate synthase large subunit [Cyanobacteria bacterium]|nr:glutamate synthase large subunit [Cyanobacteriota bacterium]
MTYAGSLLKMPSLYHPEFERDNCGFGLIANIDDKPSHNLLETAITSLARLTHRGAVAPDGITGDGCGILVKMPKGFFKEIALENNIELPEKYAVISVFVNRDQAIASSALSWLRKELRTVGLEVLWERLVPVDESYCGKEALESIPCFMQVFVKPNEANLQIDEKEFDRKLYIARRKTRIGLGERQPDFYIASCSCKTLSYKGLLMPHNLNKFFLDLADPRFKTSLCLYHQRFSTNTFPMWKLAQPFRYLAHNGEINTIKGNRNWSYSRESKYQTPLIPNFHELLPLVCKTGSDSLSLDNMLEGLLMIGMDIIKAITILIPPAWQNDELMEPDLRSFYEFYASFMDPWDGPAALVLTDGDYAVCALDKNGLRPARYVITKDRTITVASEIGVYDYNDADVIEKGRIKPGSILAIDFKQGTILRQAEINKHLTKNNEYKTWVSSFSKQYRPDFIEEIPGCDPIFEHELKIYEKQFQLTKEERTQILKPLAQDGAEATSSMGDDTPLAVLSEKVRPLYEYFRQQFAQVTNPAIDPIREKRVMSLSTCLGKEANPFVDSSENAYKIEVRSPVISRSTFKLLLQPDDPHFSYETIDITYHESSNLKDAIVKICDKAETAVRNGKVMLFITDRRIKRNRVPIHALLAVGAINARLFKEGLRSDANLCVETGTVRDAHHCAALVGFGATVIYPYLAYQELYFMAQRNEIKTDDTVALMETYRDGLNKGLMKILSKMGISTINSYRGAQLFEAIGIHEEVIDLCFPGTISRIQGAGFDDLEKDARSLSQAAWDPTKDMENGGLIKFRPKTEYHIFNPDVINALRLAASSNDYEKYKEFTSLLAQKPITALRDLFKLKYSAKPIPLDLVEPVEAITKRFSSAAMSLGAISPEAHEAIAIAMNRLGGKSNSGEGGEDSARFNTEKNSRIKQVASGRFGVTPEYLVNADELQIKISQGAKPGEGGQLPGFKVNEMIAKLRYTKPGTTLISPPPHHDIYSIEDLAQLIFDLKQINPDALVSVKLVAGAGVGTVATGVAKTYADSITIAGHDGGTGASPVSSIRYAGIPWELGLAETNLVLRKNNLRDKVRLQVDGGFKVGLDVVKAAILGAELYGFGTAVLVSLGCRFLRICHLNTCPTGIATQDPSLREKYYKGAPDHAEAYLRFVAMEVREILAALGVKSIEEIIGKTEFLELLPGITEKQKNLSLGIFTQVVDDLIDKPRYCMQDKNDPFDKAILANRMLCDAKEAIENETSLELEYSIQNTDRSIAALISGEIARRYGNQGLTKSEISFRFNGSAGQSFGVWNLNGLNLYLEGDANDYVGKGMAGGKIVIHPPKGHCYASQDTPIAGNGCLYGATGGKLYLSGQAGERFAIRNSGAIAILEGVGDHCCEYMTGGLVVVLGETGINFAAGMTGGIALVYDIDGKFDKRINYDGIEIANLVSEHGDFLRVALEDFVQETGSGWAQSILDDFENKLEQFVMVKPIGDCDFQRIAGVYLAAKQVH